MPPPANSISIRAAAGKVSRGNPRMKTIGMTACMPTATAHRPSPVTRPPIKLMTPIMMSAATGHGSANWIATVERSASAKPKPSVRAFSRQGAGRSEMLADIAPSVAGWPAAKPKIADAARATAITPRPTLAPLMMCWPTRSRRRLGGRGQRSMGPGKVLGGRLALFQRLDRAHRDRVKAGMALIGKDDDLANHLWRPVEAQMRSDPLGRFPLGHGGVEIADLIGHAHKSIELACRHAANPPLASSFPPSKHKAWSRRATTIRRTPKR